MKADTHIAPYFAKSITPVYGLNHLGLRNAAEDLFTTLLPGLNGVTQRIRYYSFYCWITGAFKDLFQGESRTEEAFRLFIRKSEILLALIQARRDAAVTGIPGITYALGTLALGYHSFDLLKCVDRPENERRTKDTYWANPGGILRQYYSSSLKDLAILPALKDKPTVSYPSNENDDLPEGTILGEDLGNAFYQSIGEETAALFISCVMRSRVTLDEMDAMKGNIVMKGFGAIGYERDLLINTLNQKDFPANENDERFLRRDTIHHFLKYCIEDRDSEGIKDSEQFPDIMYRKVLEGEATDDCSLGWYAYHINDRWQYYSSVIFACLLEILQKNGGWVSVKSIAKQLADGMFKALVSEKNPSLGRVCDQIDKRVIVPLNDVDSLEEEAASAMVSLLILYCENRGHTDIINNYKNAFRELRRNDFFTFMNELNSLQEVSFLEFLEDYIIQKIVYRHHTVSLIKYSATRVASNKFLLEDGYLRFLEQTDCTATAPRIDSLIEYLTDLGLIEKMYPTSDAIERYGLK